MQHAYNNEASMFHVHRHEHRGKPRFSRTDLDEYPKFVPDFWNVQPQLPHGAVVLSHDKASGLAWYPSQTTPLPIDDFWVVG